MKSNAKKSSPAKESKPTGPEAEIAHWFKNLRKQGLSLSQRELSERTKIPLGTIRYFEQTGRISFQSFLRIASELQALDLLLALARGEEPHTFHKIQKEKTISRLRDELAMQSKQADPMEIRQRNAPIPPISRWRLNGREKWMSTATEGPTI